MWILIFISIGKIRDSIVLTDVHDADDQLDSDHIMSEIVTAPCSGVQ